METGRNLLTRHAALIDSALVAVIFLYNLPIQFNAVPDHLWSGTGLIVSLGLCAPYLLRRQHPLPVFIAITLVAAVQFGLGLDLMVADLMIVLALYNLSSRYPWFLAAPAAFVTAVLTLIATAESLRAGYFSLGEVGLLIAFVLWAGTWGALVRFRRAHIADLRERAERLEREAEAQRQIVAAQERSRIAREIHDVVSHSLSVTTVLAEGAAATVERDPAEAKRAMEDVRDTSRSAMAEMRTMLDVLRAGEGPEHAPQPGIADLEDLVEESRAAGLTVDLRRRGVSSPLPEGLSLTVYRTVQEALTNVRKHAGPAVRAVHVDLEQSPTSVSVRVTDDGDGGRGGRTGDIDSSGGHGLIGMRERISAYGGTLSAGPRAEGGFEVGVRLPIEDPRPGETIHSDETPPPNGGLP